MPGLLSRLLPPLALRAKPEKMLGGARMLGRDGEEFRADPGRGLIVGLMRMGYGHYRMGRSAITWGLNARADVYVHDPLSIPSVEATALRLTERAYSECSRLSAACGGPVENAWGWVTKNGGRGSQDASRALMSGLERLMSGVSRRLPVVGAHPWNAHLAVSCGFDRVVNLVPDACPQAFCVVPEAMNLCQNEETLAGVLALGVAPDRAAVAGHWVPAELCENAVSDSEIRLSRLGRKTPLRLLFSIGGAGAQSAYLKDLFARLAPRARQGRLRLIINAGDHRLLALDLENALKEAGLSVARLCASEKLDEFLAAHPLDGAEPEAEAVLIGAGDPLEAVTATDRLMRAADVLVTKPSELAFFPLPKLHIRRVGDHEAPSALYAARLGDGTTERRQPSEAAAQIEEWLAAPEGLAGLNEGVRAAARRGVYSGSKAAVEFALGRN